jgi:hypothetical protein
MARTPKKTPRIRTGPGRKPLPPDLRRDNVYAVRLNDQQREGIMERAGGRPIADWIYNVVKDHLDGRLVAQSEVASALEQIRAAESEARALQEQVKRDIAELRRMAGRKRK